MERDEEECSNTRCELYINKIETKISLHRVSCEDHNHQGLTHHQLTPDDCDPHMKNGVGKS